MRRYSVVSVIGLSLMLTASSAFAQDAGDACIWIGLAVPAKGTTKTLIDDAFERELRHILRAQAKIASRFTNMPVEQVVAECNKAERETCRQARAFLREAMSGSRYAKMLTCN